MFFCWGVWVWLIYWNRFSQCWGLIWRTWLAGKIFCFCEIDLFFVWFPVVRSEGLQGIQTRVRKETIKTKCFWNKNKIATHIHWKSSLFVWGMGASFMVTLFFCKSFFLFFVFSSIFWSFFFVDAFTRNRCSFVYYFWCTQQTKPMWKNHFPLLPQIDT